MKGQWLDAITITDALNESANFHRHCLGMINAAVELRQQQTMQAYNVWQQPQSTQILLLHIYNIDLLISEPVHS